MPAVHAVADKDCVNLSEKELREGFDGHGVINVKIIKIHRDRKEIPTKHVILTFCSGALSESVGAGYVKIRVRPHIPDPRRCCGHGSASCRGQAACARSVAFLTTRLTVAMLHLTL